MSNPPSTDPRSLPFFRYTKGERRFLRIKQKLNEEQMHQLQANMSELRAWNIEQQMRPQAGADVRRTVDTATRPDVTS